MIELQRHSFIFGDSAVQFPKDDLNLIDAIFDKASVRPRNIVLARYEKYFARLHKVFDSYHRYLRFSARTVGYVCPRTVRASCASFFYFARVLT